MKPLLLAIPLLVLVVSGCCGMSGSSSCPLGTYGSACSSLCAKASGTPYDGGPACVSDCMDGARDAGLGDATTCCTESISRACQRTCAAQVAATVARYGGTMGEEQQEEIWECVGECTGPYEQMGVPLDSCNVLSFPGG